MTLTLPGRTPRRCKLEGDTNLRQLVPIEVVAGGAAQAALLPPREAEICGSLVYVDPEADDDANVGLWLTTEKKRYRLRFKGHEELRDPLIDAAPAEICVRPAAAKKPPAKSSRLIVTEFRLRGRDAH